MKRVPLKFLWWPLAKAQEGIGGKARFYTIAGVVLLAIVIGLMIAVPYPLRMEAKGQMVPVQIAQIFPPKEGKVLDIFVMPGDRINPRFRAVSMWSPELEKDFTQVKDEFDSANKLAISLKISLQNLGQGDQNKSERLQYEKELASAEVKRDAAQSKLRALEQQYNCQPDRPGFFFAIAPPFDTKLATPFGKSEWTVLNDDRRENLRGRTMRPHEELIRVGNIHGTWQIELKVPQRNIGQIMRAYTDPELHKVDEAGKKYLDVDVLLSSQPETSYGGRLYRDDIAAQAVPNKNEHDENEPVVSAYVKLNLPDFKPEDMIPKEQLVTGLEVRTRIRCGKHALGYSMFHGVWEWFYEKVVFFF
jgi:hypothetical protein